MQELSRRQREILEFIARSQVKYQQTPSLHEIREHFSLRAIGTVQDHLRVLEKKGYIMRERKARHILLSRKARKILAFDLEKQSPNIVRLPILGQVAAGRPLFAEENHLGTMDIDRNLIRTKEAFLLQVEGQSMVDAHIQGGDYVIVHPRKGADTGEIVVALVDGEATVKRFYRGQGREILLKPENPEMDSISVSVDRIEIIGKVIGVIRKL